nr:hypothetical protein [uncultured Campylobacter sp.]
MVNLARKTRCALNLRGILRLVLAVKFDSPDERAVKFEPVQKTGFAGLRSKTGYPTQ